MIQSPAFDIISKRINFGFQFFILAQLDLQEFHRHARFLLHPARREQIGIRQLVVVPAEVVDLDATFLDQCLEAKIHLAQTDLQLLRQVALGQAEVFFQRFEQRIMCRWVKHLWCVQLVNGAHYNRRVSAVSSNPAGHLYCAHLCQTEVRPTQPPSFVDRHRPLFRTERCGHGRTCSIATSFPCTTIGLAALI